MGYNICALIYMSYVKKAMLDAKLFDRWTMQGFVRVVNPVNGFLRKSLTNKAFPCIMITTVPDTPLNDAYHVGSFNYRE